MDMPCHSREQMFGCRTCVPSKAGRRPPVDCAAVADRYRCTACGNLTRFDVTTATRSRAFHHYSVGGSLTVEELEVLEERVERVDCRWCGPGVRVEAVPVEQVHGP